MSERLTEKQLAQLHEDLMARNRKRWNEVLFTCPKCEAHYTVPDKTKVCPVCDYGVNQETAVRGVCAFPACTCSTRMMCPIVLGHRRFPDRVRTFLRKWCWQREQGLERLSLRFWFRWILTGKYQ